MRTTFIIFATLFIGTCSGQDSIRILGKWYTCGWVEPLEKMDVQSFSRKELSEDSCKNFKCAISIWEFGDTTFTRQSSSGCKDYALGLGTISKGLSWSFDNGRKRLTIRSDGQKEFVFDVLGLTDAELIVRLIKPH
jgi:hypothetical protein